MPQDMTLLHLGVEFCRAVQDDEFTEAEDIRKDIGQRVRELEKNPCN